MIKKQLTKCIAFIASALLCAGMLASCNGGNGSEDKTSVFEGNNAESASQEASTQPSSNEEPRFDYFSADIFEYISIDSSAYENLEVNISKDYLVTDEYVQEYIDYLRFQNKTVLNDGAKYTDREIEIGDTVYIYFRGEMDGEEFDGGSNMSDTSPYELSIGSGSFIDGFEDGLVGIKPNETSESNMLELNLRFPDKYNNKEVAGKDVVFYVWVLYTVKYQVPEYDATFITETLKYEAESDDVVAEHREYLREMLESSMEGDREAAIEDSIWKQMIAAATITKYPEGEVEYFYNSIIDNFKYYMDYYTYFGYTFEDLGDFAVQYMGLEEGADWEAAIEKQAQDLVAQSLLCHAICRMNNDSVTEEDLNEQIEYYIEYYKGQGSTYTAEEIVEMMGETYLKEYALYGKVYDPIRENCTVNYVD